MRVPELLRLRELHSLPLQGGGLGRGSPWSPRCCI